MGIGTSIFLIAVGAILKWAVLFTIQGVDIQTIGLILMVVGILGLAISLIWFAPWSARRRATPAAPVERDPYA